MIKKITNEEVFEESYTPYIPYNIETSKIPIYPKEIEVTYKN